MLAEIEIIMQVYAGEYRGEVLELEFEVLFGNIESMRPFCDGLTERYGLEPKLITKYEQAYKIAHDEAI